MAWRRWSVEGQRGEWRVSCGALSRVSVPCALWTAGAGPGGGAPRQTWDVGATTSIVTTSLLSVSHSLYTTIVVLAPAHWLIITPPPPLHVSATAMPLAAALVPIASLVRFAAALWPLTSPYVAADATPAIAPIAAAAAAATAAAATAAAATAAAARAIRYLLVLWHNGAESDER